MTKKERVLAAIKRKKIDRIPIDYNFENDETFLFFAGKFGMQPEEFFEYLDIDIKRLYIMDDIQMFLTNEELMEFSLSNGFAVREKNDEKIVIDRWGIGWHTSSNGQRPVFNPIKKAEDIFSYQVPSLEKQGLFYHVDKYFKEFFNKGYAVFIAQYYGLFEKAWLIRGYENFFLDYFDKKEYIEVLLDKITNYKIELAKKIIKYDVLFGHSCDDLGTQRGPIMSLELWRELFKPRIKKIWDIYKKRGLPIVHHSCGDCRLYLDDMIEIGLDVIHPVQSNAMNLPELKRRYGSRLSFYGGIDCQNILANGTPNEVKKNVYDVVKILGKGGGLILAAINIMRNTPIENFKALVESINKYKYFVN